MILPCVVCCFSFLVETVCNLNLHLLQHNDLLEKGYKEKFWQSPPGLCALFFLWESLKSKKQRQNNKKNPTKSSPQGGQRGKNDQSLSRWLSSNGLTSQSSTRPLPVAPKGDVSPRQWYVFWVSVHFWNLQKYFASCPATCALPLNWLLGLPSSHSDFSNRVSLYWVPLSAELLPCPPHTHTHAHTVGV